MKKKLRCLKSFKNKKAALLPENILFIVLNLVFLSILLIFVYSKSGGLELYEEAYAKNIALLIDSSRPGTEFYLNLEGGIKKAEEEGFDLNKIVQINENIVKVQLSEKSKYTYSFFNDVDVLVKFDNSEEGKKGFFFIIKEKQEGVD